MNTLTQNINNLDAKLSLNEIKAIDSDSGTYEVIENECITSSSFQELSISGSLFSLTTFIGVSFESCTFFGSRIENCNFISCSFQDCKFEFSNIEHTKFNKCDFINTLWELSPVKSCSFAFSNLDANTNYFIKRESNTLLSCEKPRDIEWSETFNSELPPIPKTESPEETVVLHISKFMDIFTGTIKYLKSA